jgi:hypothetical protein
MTTILFAAIGVIFFLLVPGWTLLLVNVRRAPEGYEDAEGFHLGKRPEVVDQHFLISTLVGTRKDTRDAPRPNVESERRSSSDTRSPMGVC